MADEQPYPEEFEQSDHIPQASHGHRAGRRQLVHAGICNGPYAREALSIRIKRSARRDRNGSLELATEDGHPRGACRRSQGRTSSFNHQVHRIKTAPYPSAEGPEPNCPRSVDGKGWNRP